jgi:crotonobetainyl-CoA:carnitine CoA-transferase CaiB-like acyl-CoA transferase
MTATRPQPLQGFRVLDLATMIAAPYCASILGEFGAEVIKVEMPGKGDPWRYFGTMTEAGSTLNWLNEARNKKSITLDLRKHEGADLLRQLIARTDILIENFRPGTLEKWGLGFEALKAIKPDLIMVRVSAYGQTGPYKNRPGYARVAHGFSGLTYLAGEPDGPPVIPGSTSLADYITGAFGAIGALMSIIARGRFKVGQMVDVSLYEGVFRMLDEMATLYARDGTIRERMGADTVNAVPHSHYETKDGRWIALACSSDKMFERLARVMDREDLIAPDRLATVAQRVERREDVNGIVADWMRKYTCDEIVRRCLDGDVPAGPINSVADIFLDPQFQARENLIEREHAKAGKLVVHNVVARLSETPGSVDTLGPDLGQHNDEIYSNLLGLASEDLQRLRSKGII